MKKKLILAGLAALATTALLASPAFAWHSNVSGTADCDQTTVTVTVPDEDWVEDDTTASGTASLGGQSKSWAINGAGSDSVVFPGVNGGQATVTGQFNTGENAGGSVDIAAVTDCEEEQTPPTTVKPPADKPKPQTGTAISKTRAPVIHKATPPDHHGPPVAPAPKPGKLPFTGAGEQTAMLIIGFAFVAGGVLLVRKVRLN